ARQPYQEPPARHDLGRMDIACPSCGALHWAGEKLSSSSSTSPKFGICCDSGQVRLPPLQPPPPPIQALFTDDSPQAKDFRENIWKYNRAFAFTSLYVTEDHSVNRGRGEPVFRILGELYHRGAPLEPSPGRTPSYAQLYIYDPQAALDHRASLNAGLKRETLATLQAALNEHNPYVRIFRHAYEVMERRRQEGNPDVSVRLQVATPTSGAHARRRNLPTADEVAVVICDSNGEDPNPRDIVLYQRSGGLRFINDLHPSYSPLYYVVLFPRGEAGWHPDLRM
ncbi:hypothetical protein DFP72DRAFT_783689, partial [Ephemerocybe angulata]